MSALSKITSVFVKKGFRIDEVMTGEHEFEPGLGPDGKHFFEFAVTWGAPSTIAFLRPSSGSFFSADLEGSVTVGGLCERAPCKGTLELKYFTERKIRYTFDFGVEGTGYQFVGEKVNILPWNLPVSHTTCFGTLKESESGKLISRSVTFFKLHKAPSFLHSFRLA